MNITKLTVDLKVGAGQSIRYIEEQIAFALIQPIKVRPLQKSIVIWGFQMLLLTLGVKTGQIGSI
ncbi:hypothetical protein VCRA2121O157_250029 [Vibrio crassostreae]|nr:hypothetical protein VCRA2113O137_210057 [Vibrio crassostreae]CAK1939255.1 hypothetical protein VCRA2113O138_250064 [Vibrio crassostreae]CAK1940572.1 hypothetical protein VCRA2113O140_250029 [Vibrio crassostreae]CAK2281880.1 hypothetical protein VCRA2116O141_180065 [Vibrio crassostreae]CAK2516626.1 hypothetical protein VCRA2113O415_570006 [Vibrio crassostreae]